MSDPKIKDLPSFNLYTSNWLAGTLTMSYEEKGLYIDLLAMQWETGHLPPDVRLRRLRVKKSVLCSILERFPVGEDGLRRNERLEAERSKQRERRDGFRKGAEKTNAKRYAKNAGDTLPPPPPPADPPPPNGSGVNGKAKKAEHPGFEEFWSAYPNKEAKPKALMAWNKEKPDLEAVIKALDWQKQSRKWVEGFIPMPTTYLNQRRWEDEPAKAATKKPQLNLKL